MAHHHHHHHSTSENIKLAFFLNLAFTLVEIIGGLMTNSVAILADALHDLGDSFALGLAWILERKSNEKATIKFSYGFRRLSLLGAFINTMILIIGSVFILSETIPRLLNPEQPHAQGMILLAIIGIGVNGVGVLRLREDKSLNARTVALHLFEDVLGWVAVLIVAILLYFFELPILDPLLSIILTVYILYNVLKQLKNISEIFLQSVPSEFDLNAFNTEVSIIDGVISTHHTHAWSLDGDHHVFTTHLVVHDHSTRSKIIEIKQQVNKLISKFHFEHITIEIELECEECSLHLC